MPMRLNEVHPMLTHFPLVMIPAAMGTEIAARVTGREDLDRLARVGMPMATGMTALTGLSGLMVEPEVRASEEGQKMLSRHRNYNLAVLGAVAGMSAYRMIRRRRPGWGYLLTGLTAIGTLAYTSYLGGRMVYGHGVGVERAGGLRREQAPAIERGNLGKVVRTAAHQIKHSVKNLVKGLIPRDLDFSFDTEEVQQGLGEDHAEGRALPAG